MGTPDLIFDLPEDLELPTFYEAYAIKETWEDGYEPLDKHAGGRTRNRARRLLRYPLGNEPKPWSKRSKRHAKVS